MAYTLTNFKIEKKNDSTATITAEITAEAFSKYRTRAIELLGKDMKVDGFRAGHIPTKVIEERIGEAAIMQEAADLAMREQYPLLIEEEKLAIIGRPDIAITKISKEEGMAFTLTATLLPEVKLPDYAAIAKKHMESAPEEAVSEQEVEETLTHLRRERAKIEKMEAGSSPEDAAKEVAGMDTLALPAIDDAFVKTLGYDSATVFTEKLRENIKSEKARHAQEKARIKTIEAIIKETRVSVPPALVEAELANMESQFAHDLAHAGQTLEQYLTDNKKTKESLHDEWREGAKKRAAMQLVMREIALKENINPDQAQIEGEVQHILSHTKDADPSAVRAYVASSLRTELVFRFLERQGSETIIPQPEA